MADRIKGITVEIGGDTTGLSKALAGVNKEIKSTQAQLKDVNSLLKLDPSNAELLSQKQRLLSQAVEETKGKLTELKSVQDQMDEGLKNGSVTQQQYDAWKREIVATEEELKNLETQTKNTDTAISATLKEAGSKVSAVGDKISGVGETMTKNVTAPIAAVGAASLAAFSEVDEGMDTIVTKTGATGDALESMENIAKDIATTIPTSFADAGTAVGEVNTRFGLTGKALQDLSTQFIEFASINNTDVNTSIGNTQMILSQFGMSASEAGNVLGLLTSVSQKTGISVDDLSNLLQQNGATFKEMGLGVGESITLMGNFEKAGIDSASMLTGLKKAASNYSKDGKSMEEGLGDLVKRLQDSSTAADATAEAYSLFGTKGGLAFVTAAKEGRISLDGLSTDLSSFGTTVSDTYEGTLDGIDSATTALNALKEAGASVGEALGDTLAPILQSVAAGLKSFAQWFSNLSPGMKDMIIKIALIAAAVGPVLIIIGKVVSAIGGIISAAGAISGVISAIAGALPALGGVIAALTGPIGIVIAIVAAAIAIGILVVKNWDSIKAAAISIWGAIRDFFSTVWQAISNTFTTVVTAIGNFLTSAWTAITTTIQTVWNGIATFFSSLWNGIVTVFTTVFEVIKTIVTTYFEIYRVIIETVLNAIVVVFTTIWNAISTVVTTVVTAIGTFLTTAWTTIQATITTVLTAIQTVFSTIWNAISSTVSSIVNGIRNTVTSVWNSISSAISSVMNAISGTVSSIWNAISSGISATVGKIYSTIKAGFDNAVDFIKELAKSAWNWGADIINGIVDGIKSCIGKVKDAIGKVAEIIRSYLHFSSPDVGPLVDYESWMPDFMSGLSKSIESSRGLVSKAMASVAGDMVISPQIKATNFTQTTDSSAALTEMLKVIRSEVTQNQQDSGDICIPVYLGGTLLDEVIVNAQKRQNLRSGGR
jgi:TP901 family phage tail tape measure protein